MVHKRLYGRHDDSGKAAREMQSKKWCQSSGGTQALGGEQRTERSRNVYDGKALHFLEVAESRNVLDNKGVNLRKPECLLKTND